MLSHMNNVTEIRQLLESLVKSDDSPVYATCNKIAIYLENHPNQRNLTIGGLRAALKRSNEDDQTLIQAAFTLTAYPFNALEVRYQLYDDLISDVSEELDYSTYMKAISEGHYIDEEGNDIDIEEFNSRAFPYFINHLQSDADTHGRSLIGSK